MKNFLLVSALAGVLVLTGCSQQKGLSQDELFEKKQECAKYKTEIEKTIDPLRLDDLFYSPTKNTCIYIYSDINGSKIVADYFTKKVILYYDLSTGTYDKTMNDTEAASKRNQTISDNDKKLKELKGE